MNEVDRLVAQLRRPSWKFWVSRTKAAERLASLGEDAAVAVPALLGLLRAEARRSSDPDVLDAVVDGPYGRALSAIAVRAIPSLVELLATPTEGIRYVAVEILGGLGPRAVPFLIEVLQGGNRKASANAAWALEKIGSDAANAVPALHKALLEAIEPDGIVHLLSGGEIRQVEIRHEVTEYEAAFLRALTSHEEVPPFELRDHELATACIAALKRVGSLASEVVPTLIYVMDAGRLDVVVRMSAESALKAITGQSLGSDAAGWRDWLRGRAPDMRA